MEESLALRTSTSSGDLTDRISDLPHSIVQHILSFLPTKDVIKFCTLSRQWFSLWKSIPSLLFYYVPGEFQGIFGFVSFVDITLTAYTSPKISKFLLELPYLYVLEEKIESWIRFARICAVEELCIDFKRSYECKENGALFGNRSAMKMNLTSVHFPDNSGRLRFRWTALKFLSLANTTLKGDIIGSILLGSPFIEFLAIRRCRFTMNHSTDKCVINVSRASLKELVIDSCTICYVFEIIAPNLLSLTVAGKMVTKTLELIDVSSLEEAAIDFSIVYPQYDGNDLEWHKRMHRSLLHELRHVNKLTVGTRFLQVVTMSVDGALFGKSRRKILKVIMKVNKEQLRGIAALLKGSPDLEQLAIKIIPTIKFVGLPENDEFAEENYWRSEMSSEKSLFQKLKIVDIAGFIHGSASNLGKVMVELGQFILANANVLQKLIIHAELDEIFEKLQCCPRASPNALVILKN